MTTSLLDYLTASLPHCLTVSLPLCLTALLLTASLPYWLTAYHLIINSALLSRSYPPFLEEMSLNVLPRRKDEEVALSQSQASQFLS
jgi:hypothetical protein